jgi:hypothetical protein
MSALGQKRTFPIAIAMSALPPQANIDGQFFDVRFVPIADIVPTGSPRRQAQESGREVSIQAPFYS